MREFGVPLHCRSAPGAPDAPATGPDGAPVAGGPRNMQQMAAQKRLQQTQAQVDEVNVTLRQTPFRGRYGPARNQHHNTAPRRRRESVRAKTGGGGAMRAVIRPTLAVVVGKTLKRS